MKLSDRQTFVHETQFHAPEMEESATIFQDLQMTSRFVEVHRSAVSSNSHISLHAHSHHEIIYCRTAENVEFLVGTNRYRLEPGDIILVPPGVSHRSLLPEHSATPFLRDVVWLNRDFAESLPGLAPAADEFQSDNPHLIRTAGTKWEPLGEMFEIAIQESLQRLTGWEEAVLGNALQLLVYLYRAIQERTVRPPKAEQPQLLDEVLGYIESHLSEKITLADTARHFWVSQSTISQLFRNKMGVSFHRSITQRRLIAAKTLINQGYPLEDVGRQVGFLDYSTFYRAFKQEFSISPRQYRKQMESAEPIHTI